MILQDVSAKATMTSQDGRRLDVTTNNTLAYVDEADWQPALNYPGQPVSHPPVTWVGTAINGKW